MPELAPWKSERRFEVEKRMETVSEKKECTYADLKTLVENLEDGEILDIEIGKQENHE